MKSPTTAMALLGLITCIHAHATQLAVTEIMYNPAASKPEYFVIKNVSQESINLSGWKADEFTFAAGEILQPSESMTVSASAPATTRSAYQLPALARIVGPNPGNLNNAGDTILIRNAGNTEILHATYTPQLPWNDAWFVAADGTGHSLIVRDERFRQDHHNWQPSLTNKCLNPARSKAGKVTPVDYGNAWRYHAPYDYRHNFSNGRYLDFLDLGDWPTGKGLFGFETEPALIPSPGIQTSVGEDGDQMVYQFRKTFEYTGDPADAAFTIDQIVDDGVRYYLNGELLGATRISEKGSWRQPAFGIPDAVEEIEAQRGTAWGLVQGTNVLLAEVHQWVVGSSDMVFGARFQITPRPALRLSEIHFAANGVVDWVELQNTSSGVVSANGLFLASRADFTDKIALSGNVSPNAFGSWDVTLPDGKSSITHTTVYLIDSFNNVLGATRVARVAPAFSAQASWPSIPSLRSASKAHNTDPAWYGSNTATRNTVNTPPQTPPTLHPGDMGALYAQTQLVGNTAQLDISDSLDLGNAPVSFYWSLDPAIPGNFTHPDPGVLQMNFSRPGLHAFTASIVDIEGLSVSLSREILVAAPEDFDSFSESDLGKAWIRHGWFRDEDNGAGKTYYPISGHGLYMRNTSAIPLDSSSLEPASITRQIPWGDFAMQLTVSRHGNAGVLSGLYLKARAAEYTGSDYVIGLEGSDRLVVRRVNSPGDDIIFSQSYPGSEVTVRACLDENHLRLQYFSNGSWITLIREDASMGFEGAGMLVAGPPNASAVFKNAYLANPYNHKDSLVKNLRLTEIGPNYRELTNIGAGTLDLSQLTIMDADFGHNMLLAPGKSIVIVPNATAFHQAHGTEMTVYEVQPAGFNYADRNAAFYLKLKDSPYVFFDFRPAFYPNLFPSGNAVEIVDPAGDYAYYHTTGSWRLVTGSPGWYFPFLTNDNDYFDSPTLKHYWSRHQWSASRGDGRYLTMADSYGNLLLENETDSTYENIWQNAIIRPIPSSDTAIETSFISSSEIGFRGLCYSTSIYSHPYISSFQFAFGIVDQSELRIQKLDGTILFTQPYSGNSAKLRVIQSGGIRSHQIHSNGGWQTVWSQSYSDIITEAGVFMKGQAGAKTWFDEVLVINPQNYPLNLSYNLKVTEVTHSYYELTNFASYMIDLSGLEVHAYDEHAGTHQWSFPEGTTIAPGHSLVMVGDLASFRQAYGNSIPAVEFNNPNIMTVTSESFHLVDSSVAPARTVIVAPPSPPSFLVITGMPTPGTHTETPQLTLNIAAKSWDVAMGDLHYFDASHNYGPDMPTLEEFGHWDYAPRYPSPLLSNWPHPAGKNVKQGAFNEPGYYIVSFHPLDAAGQRHHVYRDLTVAHPRDIDRFTSPTLSSQWVPYNTTVTNTPGNTPGPSTYSLTQHPGKLTMNATGQHTLRRIGDNSQDAIPVILQSLPGSNCSVQVNVREVSGYLHSAGLFVCTQNNQGHQYAFLLNSGLQVLRSTDGVSDGAFAEVFRDDYVANLNHPTDLRIRSSTAGLEFQIRRNLVPEGNNVWKTIWTDSSATTLTHGGPVISSKFGFTTPADHVSKFEFDDFIVVNPKHRSRAKDHLKVTKFSADFVELTNLGPASMDLDGIVIQSDTYSWTISADTSLGSGESLLLVENATAFRQTHGIHLRIIEQAQLFPLGEMRPTAVFRMAEAGSSQWFFSFYPNDTPRGYGALEIRDPWVAPHYFNWKPIQGVPGKWFPDADADGISDNVETSFGSNPNNANSRHLFTVEKNSSGQPDLSWSTVNGRFYQVEYCNELGEPWQVLAEFIGNGSTLDFADTTSPRPAKRFYRIVAP